MTPNVVTPYQSQFYAWHLSRVTASDSVDALASTLVDAQVDLNPHQVEAALFACCNPLSRGVILADEVGLGKTIEAGLVMSQWWAERRRKMLIIVPASLRKQWHQELQDKFGLEARILESKSWKALRKQGKANPFAAVGGPIICSYPFAKARAAELKSVPWDLVIFDEAHRLRNVYKSGNVIAKTLRDALAHVRAKVLLTATPLQNSLSELYGLVSIIDDRVFGDLTSFRSQFVGPGKDHHFQKLRQRLASVCKRTLRKQVQPYVSYTARRAIVQEFTPSDEEQALSQQVADYLRRPNLKALPDGQRQLISLVLWKLLASSSHAIAGALDTMANRLQAVLDESAEADLADSLDADYESLAETAEEWSAEADAEPPLSAKEREVFAAEVAELRQFTDMATHIRDNAKGNALLQGLERAFAELERLDAPKKAIIFTESKRTQAYLQRLLEGTPYAGTHGEGLVLFNGSNDTPHAKAIYRAWCDRHAGTDRITGARSADTRAALVEYFREQGTIKIATEAGAEGINLQFCSLVINYDLPWNPQRIEQRIGRCHRYGQKHDVVVVNFIDRNNKADARVYELLSEKLQLFEGVFGSSDEVLGAIGTGVDFERRVADIYQHCREPDEIEARFDQLQLDLAGEIDAAMLKTRQILLDNFDEQVQEKLRIQNEESYNVRNKYERMLMDLTEAELGDAATFDDQGFTLQQRPATLAPDVPTGRYELPRRSGESRLYRIGHPLAKHLIDQAKARSLPSARLTFVYAAYGKKQSTLEPWRGQQGQIIVKLISVDAFHKREQHLLVAAVSEIGEPLLEDDPEKLLRLPATVEAESIELTPSPALLDDIEARKKHLLRDIKQRNLGYFEQEAQKLDDWADDLKLGLEQDIKDIDREINDVRRTAATAATLEDKLAWQKKQRELERKRSKLRRELFESQDRVEGERNDLIDRLEVQLEQRIDEQTLFTIEWTLE